MDKELSKGKLDNLATKKREEWDRILKESRFMTAIQSGEFDKRLYAIHLIQTYHYTLHNSRNQAAVGVSNMNVTPQYLNFCFDHAAEEAGHEMMAIHDLKGIGYDRPLSELPRPLPSTDTLVGYLYWISSNGNPLQRLGYSYWAETCYEHINPVLSKIKDKLQLKDAQMTFFVAHSSIDEKHADEVERIILSQCQTEDDWHSIEQTMLTSLRLTETMVDEVMDEYVKLVQGKETEYSFLN